MFYDLSYLGPWLLLALILGVAVGWRTAMPGPQRMWTLGWFRVLAIAVIVAFLIALFGLFPGRFEFWFESAVWFIIVYLIGCLFGGGVQRRRPVA